MPTATHSGPTCTPQESAVPRRGRKVAPSPRCAKSGRRFLIRTGIPENHQDPGAPLQTLHEFRGVSWTLPPDPWVWGWGAPMEREQGSRQQSGPSFPCHCAVRGTSAEKNPAENPEQTVSPGEPEKEKGIYRRPGNSVRLGGTGMPHVGEGNRGQEEGCNSD